jgi:hypothetical protein
MIILPGPNLAGFRSIPTMLKLHMQFTKVRHEGPDLEPDLAVS